MGLILVRFGEIGIKSPQVRVRFERRLVETLEDALAARRVEASLDRSWGRIYIHATDVDGALDAAVHTFGVVSASPAVEVPPDLGGLVAAVRDAATALVPAGSSFAVRARRTGNQAFTSLDVARAAGGAVLEKVPDARVDLKDPDVEVYLEVREDRAYLFTRRAAGPGGLPLGAQGRAVAYVTSPRGALATWLILRRGANVTVVVPEEHEENLYPVLDQLRVWAPRLKVATDRRDRKAALQAWTRRVNAHAAVVGDAWPVEGEDLDASLPVPVFRPLLGYPADRLATLARTVGVQLPVEASP